MRATHHHPNSTVEASRPGAESFAIEVSTGRRATRVRVVGELDAASASQLSDALLAAGGTDRTVELDLGPTSFIDSAGIRILVRSMWTLQGAGSALVLVAASPMAENILRITGILDVLKDPTP